MWRVGGRSVGRAASDRVDVGVVAQGMQGSTHGRVDEAIGELCHLEGGTHALAEQRTHRRHDVRVLGCLGEYRQLRVIPEP